MSMKSRFVFALMPVLLFASLMLSAGCEEKLKPPLVQMPVGEELPDQESWDAKINFSDSGIVRAVMTAGRIRKYNDRMKTMLDSGVVVDFYDESGVHSSRLTSDRGEVDDQTNIVEAFGDVVFISDSGTVVETEYLYWDTEEQKVMGDRFVTITSPTERLQGYGFEADQDLKNYVIRGRISGEAKLDEQ